MQPRTEGESKWSVMSLVKYAFSNISSFSTAPMQIVTILGCVMLIASVIFGGISLVQKNNRSCIGRIYNRHFASAFHRKYYDVESWCDWVLYIKNL